MSEEQEGLVKWLKEHADQHDESAELWAEPGCEEAVNERREAIRFRRCAELIEDAPRRMENEKRS